MIFKSSTVALLVSSALVLSAHASDVESTIEKLSAGKQTSSDISTTSDVKSAFINTNENIGVYFLRLSEKSALDSTYAAMGTDRRSVVAKVEQQQDMVMQTIRGFDAAAILTNKAKLTDNVLFVQMNHDVVAQLAAISAITSIQLLNETPSYTSTDEVKKFPFLTIKDPGDAVTVAIIGNGVDYTHKTLGGAGTVAAYQQAWANKSNAWDGFPTDTVIGGLDFSAYGESSYHDIDYNPIENFEDVDVESGFLASGTAMAGQILQQAPDAKLLAYKTWDWSSVYYYPVLDVVIDPNQDGDISDRPDIVLVNSYGNSAFYVEGDQMGSQSTRDIELTRRLAAAGSLIVTGAGQSEYNSYFNTAWRGAVPEALTVGSVGIVDDVVTLSKLTPAGPTRGTQQLKPEVVAPAEHLTGAVAGSGDLETDLAYHHSLGAAHVAGIAAKIMANFPELSALEVKALLANTAVASGIQGGVYHDEASGTTITNVAEVPFMGSGLVNSDNANTAQAIVWETSNYQPNLAFGFVEATTNASVDRNITIKNLTDDVQTYTLSSTVYGDKANNNAISFIYPETINVPANHAVSFNVSLLVAADKLAKWPIRSSEDYSIENWTKASVNGALVFENTQEGSVNLSLPWQVFPKNNKDVAKTDFSTSSTTPYDSGAFGEYAYEFGVIADEYGMNITNTTNDNKLVYTMSLMHHVDFIPESKAQGQGNMIKNIGASVVAEQQCESGSKLSIALQMFDKFDVPMAKHFDKAGHLLTYFTIYPSQVADRFIDNPEKIEDLGAVADSEKLAYFEILTDENGQPQASFVDFETVYEWWNPRGRFKASTLSVDVAPGDDIMVANVCLEELYHHDMQSAEIFDENLGWQFATDRDAQSEKHAPLIRFNPVRGGLYMDEVIDHTGEYNYPPNTYVNCDANGTDSMGNPFPEDYCLEETTTYLASSTAITKLPADTAAELNWSNSVLLAPGETARVSSSTLQFCDPYIISFGEHVVDERCPPGVMIFEIGNDNAAFAVANFGGEPAIKPGQSFSVYENVANDTVVGQLAFTTEGFFIEDEGKGEVYLLNALPGTPFAVSTEGVISVANADAIDYEQYTSFTLSITVDYGKYDTVATPVVININNRNDVAPVVVQTLAPVSIQSGEYIALATAQAFADIEGDGMTFNATNLPQGLTISRAGTVTGSTSHIGEHSAMITATDGVNNTSTPLTISVQSNAAVPTPAPVGSETANASAGSSAQMLLLLFGLALIRRRVFK